MCVYTGVPTGDSAARAFKPAVYLHRAMRRAMRAVYVPGSVYGRADSMTRLLRGGQCARVHRACIRQHTSAYAGIALECIACKPAEYAAVSY